jgi:hypothetical protein
MIQIILKPLSHMDFYPDKGPSKLKACELDKRLDNVETNTNKDERIILYEEQSSSKNYDNVSLSEKDLTPEKLYMASVNSLISQFNSVVNFFKKFFYTKPKRLFTTAHQFFGCSHLMAVRYYIHSINDCVFRADCGSLNISSAAAGGFARMGYWSSRSPEIFKRSKASFFVNTTDSAPYCLDKKSKESV